MLKRRSRIAKVQPAEAVHLALSGALLVDVREPAEWASGHAPGAVHMPLGQLDPATVPPDRVVIAVCRSGNRSGTAATQLAAAGVDVRNMAGGMAAWASSGLPVVTDDGGTGEVS